MQAPRVRCQSCGAKTWHQPKFAEGQKRYTKNFEKFVCGWLSRVTIQDVVETCGLSWDTVAEIEMMFSHIDQNMSGVKFPEHNFVFTEQFTELLKTYRNEAAIPL